MEIQKILEAMEACNREDAENTHGKFRYGAALTDEIRRNAVSKIAPDVSQEEILGVYDTSFGGKGKSGLVVTDRQVCSRKLKNGPIMLEGLSFVSWVARWRERICFLYEDGRIRETGVDENTELRKISTFFESLCGRRAAAQAPVSEWEDLHRRKGRTIRRKIEEAAFASGMAYGNMYAGAGLDEELWAKLHHQDYEGLVREDVIFYNGSVGGKLGFVVTEYGLYDTGLLKDKDSMGILSFDGLTVFVRSSQNPEELFAVYENGFVRALWINTFEKDEVLIDFVNRAAGIVKEQRQADLQRRGKAGGLSAVEGWEQFLALQRKQVPDAANNSIFISSTFRDMHYERDQIHDFVLPGLNQLGERYGQQVSVCDLRWGVNTGNLDEEERSRKVLTVCLDEIERCRPYMLIMLGDRYGWIPEAAAMQEAIAGRPELILDELEKSVTELEIEFGALSGSQQAERIFFYFRSFEGEPSQVYRSEDRRHAEKLARLKERIQRLSGNAVRSYTLTWQGEEQKPLGLEDFADRVLADLTEAMQKDWQQHRSRTPKQLEERAHWELAERKAGVCSARDSFLQECMELLEDGSPLLAVTGASGSGKSTVMGCLAVAERLRGRRVLPIFCGYTKESQTGLDIVKKITGFLAECLGQEEPGAEQEEKNPEWWLAQMEHLAAACREKGIQALVVLDAVDQLVPDSVCERHSYIPDQLSETVQMVFSTLTGETLPYLAAECVLPLVEKRDRPAVIRGNLRLYRRELEDCVIQAIAEKAGAEQPLYVSLLTQRLLMMNKHDFDDISERGDGLDAISQYQLRLVEQSPDTVAEMCMTLIEAAARRIGHDFVTRAVECIGLSRYGLREGDLEGILRKMGIPWNSLDFSLFFHSLRSMFLVHADGRYDLSHSGIRRGVLASVTDPCALHGQIADWLEQLPASDIVRRQELIYHSLEGGRISYFRTWLGQYHTQTREVKEAAARLAEYCSKNREVMEQLIARAEAEKDFVFLRFTAYEFWRAAEDLELLEKSLQAGKRAAEQFKELGETWKEKRLCGVFCSRLGWLYQRKGETDQAIGYKQQALEEVLCLAKQQEPQLWEDVCITYRQIAELLLEKGDPASLETAEGCLKEALAAAERADSPYSAAFVHKAYARYYEKINRPDQVIVQGELRVTRLEEALGKEATGKRRSALASACDDLGFLYRDRKRETGDSARARELFVREKELLLEVIQEEETADSLCSLAYTQAILADILCEEIQKEAKAEKPSGEQKEKQTQEQAAKQEQALALYESSIRLFETLRKRGTKEDSRGRMGTVCQMTARLCLKMGKPEHKEACRAYGLLALDIREELVRKDPSVENYRSLKSALQLALRADETHTERHIKRCMEVCQWLQQQGVPGQKLTMQQLKVWKGIHWVQTKV